ncbi:peptidase M23 [Haladaptatus sp. R4]|uniref:M23 family metallopeptidase n=1 Tax=Haladaptatus sp. R4 TaxID=1679489 RepID=UPI0007B4A75C|nr:M23 family metallopeptidase [Haladaptatus sp. R4]KZN24023.1 peptidase M23 [Haladaptatus sp. R4]
MSRARSPTDSGDGGESNRRSGLLKKVPDPTNLFLLGFVSIPGYLFESLRPLRRCALFFLFGLWPFVRMVAPARVNGSSPTDWIRFSEAQRKWCMVLSVLFMQLNPFVQGKSLLQLGGHILILARHRGRLPNPERFEQSTSFHLPFADPSDYDAADGAALPDSCDDTWTVANGSPNRENSHSWGVLTQRYAYDFVITDGDGNTHTGDGSRPEEYYCFGEPIYASADGVVVETHDGHRDHGRVDGWFDVFQRDIRGNWVTIEHADGEYSVSAHLRCGSVEVAPGDRVERGQQIGRCGHSGNSTEPHLHFHVQDRPNFYLGMGLPIRFDGVVARDGRKTDERDDFDETPTRQYITAGQRVIPADD